MHTTAILAINIAPLYILIGLGYVAGRWLDVNLHSVARILIFILSPIVTFGAVAQLKFTADYAMLPVIGLALSAVAGLSMYRLARWRWRDDTPSLIGIGSVSGNTGYFGLPLVLALHGESWTGVYLLLNFGVTIGESTIGYFLGARGHHTWRQSLLKVVKLPVVHALYLGLLANFLLRETGLSFPGLALRYWNHAIGAWIYLGMMMIGVALSKIEKFELDLRLLGWLYAAKFLLWPLLGLLVVVVDRTVLHLFSPVIYSLILIIVSVPPAGNLVAYATQLNLHAEKAALAVLIGTLAAIVLMPLIFLLVEPLGLIPKLSNKLHFIMFVDSFYNICHLLSYRSKTEK